MSGQVTKAVKEDRAHRAAQVAGQMEENYLRSFVGQKLPVLFEESIPDRPGLWRGHAPNYAEVWCESGESLHNQMRRVAVTAVEEGRLSGILLPL